MKKIIITLLIVLMAVSIVNAGNLSDNDGVLKYESILICDASDNCNYIGDSEESTLDVNSADYWDTADTSNSTQFNIVSNILTLDLSWLLGYLNPLFIGQNEYPFLDTNYSDDYSDSDIDGTETAFNGWDKNASDDSDDQTLSFNNATNILSIESGNSIDLSNLSSTESDPVFGSSHASSITSTNTTNWNLAYSWGNHANFNYSTGGFAQCSGTDQATNITINTSGIYLGCTAQGSGGGGMSSFTIDTDNEASTDITDGETITFSEGSNMQVYRVGNTITFNSSYTDTNETTRVDALFTNISNWNTAYGWGDHALAGYLTSYTETDPLWTGNSSLVVYASDTSNWDKNNADDFSGNFTDLDFTGTTGFSDGVDNDTDTQLSEAQVEGFIFDNDNTGTLNTTGNIAFGSQGLITHNSTCMILKSPDAGTTLSICN